MGAVLSFIGYILLAASLVVVFLAVIVGFKLIMWFNFKSCKCCHHTMIYKGLRKDDRNGHYLFHCEHCGAWEEIPKEEFIHNCDSDCNPNVL